MEGIDKAGIVFSVERPYNDYRKVIDYAFKISLGGILAVLISVRLGKAIFYTPRGMLASHVLAADTIIVSPAPRRELDEFPLPRIAKDIGVNFSSRKSTE